MQTWESTIIVAVFWVAILILAAKCYGSPGRSQIRRARGTRPSPRGDGNIPAAYAADVSYVPNTRGGEKGPLPIGGRTEPRRTETYRRYSDEEN